MTADTAYDAWRARQYRRLHFWSLGVIVSFVERWL